MEHFEITENFWIARWLKKPTKREIKAGANGIMKSNLTITLGVAESISEKIIKEYFIIKKIYSMFGREQTDFDGIGQKMELPRAVILLVLERKGIINKTSVRKR